MRRLAMAGLAAAMLATGCVLIPIPTDLPENPSSEDLALLRRGTTTRADMVRLLGPPQLEVGDRQALWSYRHEKGRIQLVLIIFVIGQGAAEPKDWGRDEDLSVLATFDGGGRLESLEWAAADGRRGTPLGASAMTVREPAAEPQALPWAQPGIAALAPDGRTAIVRRSGGAGFRLVDRGARDVAALPVDLCSPGFTSAAFLRDGAALFAAAGHSPCTVDLTSSPPDVVVWPETSKFSRNEASAARLSRDGALVVATFQEERVEVIRTADGSVARSLPIPNAVIAALAPDGSSVAAVSAAEAGAWTVRVIEVAAGNASVDLRRTRPISAMAFDGQRVVLGFDGHVEVWRMPDLGGAWTAEHVMLRPRYRMLAFVGDGRRLAAEADSSVAAWDVSGWRQVLDLPIPPGRGAAFAADGSAVVTGAGFVDLPPLSQ